MQIQRLDIFEHTSQYSVFSHFNAQLVHALERRGISCRIFDVRDGAGECFQEIMRDPPDLTCSFSPLGIPPGTLWPCDALRVPHLTYNVDAIVRGFEHFTHPYAFFSTVDYQQWRNFRSAAGSQLLFLPHAIEREFEADLACERPYDILMCATYTDYAAEMESWEWSFTPEVCKGMHRAVQLILDNATLSMPEALDKAFEGPAAEALRIRYGTIYQRVEKYCKGRDRVNLIRALSGFNIHLFGSQNGVQDWRRDLKDADHVIVHAPVSFKESLDLFRKSKIILNSSPQFRHGSHERVLYGLAAGAAVITNENPYLQNHFNRHSGVLYYLPGKEQELNELVAALLADEPLRRQITSKGRTAVLQNHTWDHRVTDLINQWHQIEEPVLT